MTVAFRFRFLIALLCVGSAMTRSTNTAFADVKMPAIFGSHMVLQQGQKNLVWGWTTDAAKTDTDEQVVVTIGDQTHIATHGENGRWFVTLEPLTGGPFTMTVKAKNTLIFDDILIGEVWICSGQSNMAMSVDRANDPDLELLTAKFPRIRLISVPQVGTQEPQADFKGQWKVCSPETVRDFSAVGYFFGRQLHQTLDVPIGLIDNSWGGSACEAWIHREVLAADPKYQPLLKRWAEEEANLPQAMADFPAKRERWQRNVAAAKANGKPAPRAPQPPDARMKGNARPANIYNGVLKPTIGYGIRGVIWYQGESNAGRAHQYRDLFPLMIQSWREEWKQGDFPFYWVQLADFQAEKPNPGDSTWAELREAQTLTLSKLPNTGEAVIIDLGEAKDIHPKNKQVVGKRLSRWALAQVYGQKIAYRSPQYQSMEKQGNKLTLTFEHTGAGLNPFDVAEPRGFTIAGADKIFVPAKATILPGGNQIEVWSDSITGPTAVRYAWADNPVCNVYSSDGLPLTPFRTDNWPGITVGKD